ncbi:MAG: response regulator [Chitinophagaceae bacterium]|nr:response regulator [Chitinophagaceae bacterium]
MAPLQILLIDDDSDDREIFAWVIKGIDPLLVIDSATDGIEALDKLKDEHYHPDLIFMDLNMPWMDGLDCLRHIREVSRLNECPVIVYSTSSNPQDIARCRIAGANDYIIKGNEVSVIKQELSQALKKHNPRLSTHE